MDFVLLLFHVKLIIVALLNFIATDVSLYYGLADLTLELNLKIIIWLPLEL